MNEPNLLLLLFFPLVGDYVTLATNGSLFQLLSHLDEKPESRQACAGARGDGQKQGLLRISGQVKDMRGLGDG